MIRIRLFASLNQFLLLLWLDLVYQTGMFQRVNIAKADDDLLIKLSDICRTNTASKVIVIHILQH